jgi:hypothetical protein
MHTFKIIISPSFFTKTSGFVKGAGPNPVYKKAKWAAAYFDSDNKSNAKKKLQREIKSSALCLFLSKVVYEV